MATKSDLKQTGTKVVEDLTNNANATTFKSGGFSYCVLYRQKDDSVLIQVSHIGSEFHQWAAVFSGPKIGSIGFPVEEFYQFFARNAQNNWKVARFPTKFVCGSPLEFEIKRYFNDPETNKKVSIVGQFVLYPIAPESETEIQKRIESKYKKVLAEKDVEIEKLKKDIENLKQDLYCAPTKIDFNIYPKEGFDANKFVPNFQIDKIPPVVSNDNFFFFTQ
jgi:hypothetical protein